MQSPCIDACKAFSSSGLFLKGFQQQFLTNNIDFRSISYPPTNRYGSYPCISCNLEEKSRRLDGGCGRPRENLKVNRGKVGAKGKDNVWSIDNEVVKTEKEKGRTRRRKRGGKRVRNVIKRGDRVLVSGSMLMEVETVLQTQVMSAYGFLLFMIISIVELGFVVRIRSRIPRAHIDIERVLENYRI